MSAFGAGHSCPREARPKEAGLFFQTNIIIVLNQHSALGFFVLAFYFADETNSYQQGSAS
jgi:hypothetical protein